MSRGGSTGRPLHGSAAAPATGLLPVGGVLFLLLRGLSGECARANDAPVVPLKLLLFSTPAVTRALLPLRLLLLSGLGKDG